MSKHSKDDDCAESVLQLASAWGAIVDDYARTRPTRPTDVRDVSGTAYRWAESDFPFWNCLTWTQTDIDTDQSRAQMAQAATYMRGKRPGFIWIFEEFLTPEACRTLFEDAAAAGLRHGLTMHGMAADILPIPRPTAASLDFVRVDSEELLTAYADINSLAYSMPLDAGREGLANSAFWKQEVYAYLALENGIPVSAAATSANNGCLFLALVATLPGAQRRGYGEATVRKALYEGARQTGLRRTTLHATMAGAPVYERIGYRKVSTIQAFGLPR